MKNTHVGEYEIGPGQPLTLIAGPCQAESYDLCIEVGETMKARCAELGVNYIFKASYDKANRSSIHTERGPGLAAGLELMGRVKEALGCR